MLASWARLSQTKKERFFRNGKPVSTSALLAANFASIGGAGVPHAETGGGVFSLGTDSDAMVMHCNLWSCATPRLGIEKVLTFQQCIASHVIPCPHAPSPTRPHTHPLSVPSVPYKRPTLFNIHDDTSLCPMLDTRSCCSFTTSMGHTVLSAKCSKNVGHL